MEYEHFYSESLREEAVKIGNDLAEYLYDILHTLKCVVSPETT